MIKMFQKKRRHIRNRNRKMSLEEWRHIKKCREEAKKYFKEGGLYKDLVPIFKKYLDLDLTVSIESIPSTNNPSCVLFMLDRKLLN